MNRLSAEKSPYLLQHAENPVHWHAWGEEAFARARREDKPVFLSIGYSTCHWCHVMAHESFEDQEVADALNRDYISIKVDREERPDVDAVYMAACQALTGSGGWPLTVLLTPDQKPFWVGTYLPKRAAYGRTGLLELLAAAKRRWDEGREKLLAAGDQIAAHIRRDNAAAAEPERALLHRAFRAFESAYDSKWGGFGPAPKFPVPHNLLFLLRYSQLEESPAARQMAEHTLLQMYRGGIFDHLGGGFSRYSTDEKWLIPHFEKMLYDNALLACAYLEAHRISKNPLFREVAERTMDYVLRELTHPEGGFFCGQDADSDGVEGKFYAFTRAEIDAALGEDGPAFARWFGIAERGNFEGKSIPNLIENPRYAQAPPPHEGLLAYRAARTSLHRDDKVLTSWNALMIAALAKAGRLRAAERALQFLKRNLIANGRLHLRWREGEAAHIGQLDDHAFYAFANLELYQATGAVEHLREAAEMAEQMLAQFWDAEGGGFYLYAADAEQLISRPKEVYDGALPSGNAVSALVLGRLFRLTGDPKWREFADAQLRFLAGAAREYPIGHSMALLAMAEALYPARELVCISPDGGIPPELRENAPPNQLILVKTRENAEALAQIAPFTRAYPIEDQPVYYLCENGACRAPIRGEYRE